MGTVMFAYLNYKDIQTMIDEHNLFETLGDFNSGAAIDKEFTTLIHLAEDVRDSTIAADASQMAADAAAIASIWTFGISMAAFPADIAPMIDVNVFK
ncbi:hypothetical protein OC845_006488 [Tilletia horrida]|nr:hypothetical protein OC845_006488 [Tilletia horrida]